MRTLVAGSLLLLGLAGAASPAVAEIGTIDAVPAATLLLPYFEVDLNDPNGITTLFSINNASATAILAHVTLWTDQAIPTFAFQVYLTGYDVQTINVRDLFNGLLPVTADDGADFADNALPNTGISNQGPLSQDINFPGGVGPCGSPATLYNAPDPSLPAKIAHIRASHTGQFSGVYGGCSGANYGDSIARGYITVDTVNSCSLFFPDSGAYFGSVATFQNVLWGDVFYVNPAQNFAQGDSLVHIEACIPGGGPPPYIGYVGNGAGRCPLVPGDYTFYARYVAGSAVDQREPLATTFATRYVNGGAFTGGTDLLVWRDTKLPPIGPSGPHSCFLAGPLTWFPMSQTDVVAFDEQEEATDLCFTTDNVAPAIGGSDPCFPLATQRTSVGAGSPPPGAAPLLPPAPFGWLFLNLSFAVAGDATGNPATAQAWVSTVIDAQGRFSVGYPAVPLDTPLDNTTGGMILLP
jgi:hypothetical protein